MINETMRLTRCQSFVEAMRTLEKTYHTTDWINGDFKAMDNAVCDLLHLTNQLEPTVLNEPTPIPCCCGTYNEYRCEGCPGDRS